MAQVAVLVQVHQGRDISRGNMNFGNETDGSYISAPSSWPTRTTRRSVAISNMQTLKTDMMMVKQDAQGDRADVVVRSTGCCLTILHGTV